ncbi:MAG TPA: ABC-F family ATP-binding cassette domain-containing protein [Rhizomicrobium sp.]|jgi:ATP-binding cassette subfamily F protein uup|nr:ABC-F family ATP-binding cassette domain-containing protein [Rhizomicrobium sp.]
MAAPLLLLQDIHVTFGNTALLDGAELSVAAGERLCLVGRNGSGKSTLLKVAAGLMEADAGNRFAQPGATIRYLAQEPSLAGYADTHAYVEAGLMPGDDPARAYYLLGKLGLSGAEAPGTLSGGEARRAALARTLAPRPDILLLDEPTNHLDLPAIEWLEGELTALKSALVLISHDRRFLENLSRATVWLDRGTTRRLEKSFAAFEPWRDEILEQEESERHKLDRKIAMEEDWVRYGVSGRRKRNQGRLAKLRGLRTGRREQIEVTGSVKLTVGEAEEGGTRVIDAKKISKSWGDKHVVRDVSIRIHRGERVGIVGPNGAGKTTLVNLLTGVLAPETGNVKIGVAVKMARLDQNRDTLAPNDTLASVLTGGRGDHIAVAGEMRHVVSYMKDFLFTPQQARSPVKVLSGGERARLLLAKVLAQPSNLLVLDEPTNDLDLETLDLLEEMIDDYPGTAIVVSHDRDFLDRVTTSILMAEDGGHFIQYAGGYSDMLAQRGSGVAAKERSKPARTGESKERRAAAPVRRKMNFSDRHDLEKLPARIAALDRQIAALQAELAAPDLYTRDAKKFAALSQALADAQHAHAAGEERWLELEMLREELERG